MEFLERLRQIINRSGDSIPVFAQNCGKSKNQVYTYLNGDQLPGMEFFTEMKKGYPWVPLEWLISETGEPPVNESHHLQEALEDPEGLPVAHQIGPATKKTEGFVVKESGAPYSTAYDQAGYLLANILSSGDQIMIQAILANLKAFNRAIDSQQKDKDRIAEFEKRVAALEEKLSDQDKKETEEEKLKKGEAA